MNFVANPANSGMPASENSPIVRDQGEEWLGLGQPAQVDNAVLAGAVVKSDQCGEHGEVGRDVADEQQDNARCGVLGFGDRVGVERGDSDE